jgi:hypothetical protein
MKIILSVVVYGYQIWSVIFRDEHWFRVFGHKVLRRIFGPKREEVPAGW